MISNYTKKKNSEIKDDLDLTKIADIIYCKNKITDFLSKLIEHTTK